MKAPIGSVYLVRYVDGKFEIVYDNSSIYNQADVVIVTEEELDALFRKVQGE